MFLYINDHIQILNCEEKQDMTDETPKATDNAKETAETLKEEAQKEVKKLDLTQADLDKLMGKRAEEERKRVSAEYDKTIADLKKQAELDKMSETERKKAESEIHEKELISRAEKAESALRLSVAEKELAKLGINSDLASRVIGANDEETVKNVQSLKASIDAEVKKQVSGSMARGAPLTGNGETKSTEEKIKNAFEKGANLKK